MSRRSALLSLVLAALLVFFGAIAFLLRPVPRARGVESPAVAPPAEPRNAPAAPVEAAQPEARVAPRVETAPPPVAPAEPPADLMAEGARRAWQLPVGKGWWFDTLLNPGAIDPGNGVGELQERLLTWADQLLELKNARKQRLDRYCQERIAAGLAFPDPQPEDVLPEGKQHVVVQTHTLEAPGRFWRIDVGPGDDAGLDDFDRRIAKLWCDAIEDLRRRIAASKR